MSVGRLCVFVIVIDVGAYVCGVLKGELLCVYLCLN